MSSSYKRVIVDRPKKYLTEPVDFDPKTCKMPTREDFAKLAKIFREQISK